MLLYEKSFNGLYFGFSSFDLATWTKELSITSEAKVSESVYKGQKIIGIYLGLSRAFDSVEYNKLL